MEDSGWRRNKYGGLFRIDDVNETQVHEYMNKKIRNAKKDISVDLMAENIYKIEDLKDLEKDELINLRDGVTEKIHWLFSSEYYDRKKIKKLSSNEKKLNDLIFKK